ncbi:hypothetical protein CKA32_000936 [Geitlerinema sp. FC II]|nr:hypothetical protein CKA32_000936 [Geitlerinema sp. FC II]
MTGGTVQQTEYSFELAIYLTFDGSCSEFLFAFQEMEFYKELWTEKLSQIGRMMSSTA